MSKKVNENLDKALSKNGVFSATLWDSAIMDAEKEIVATKNRVKDLQKAIGVFNDMLDRNVRFEDLLTY